MSVRNDQKGRLKLTRNELPSIINDVLVALYWLISYVVKGLIVFSTVTDLEAIAQPMTPNRFPTRKKFLRPKMSLHLPAMVITTALASAHDVAAHVMLVDGPTSSFMVRRMLAGKANENRHAS